MIWLIVAIALTLRLVSLGQSFWLDEAAQATLSRHALTAINWAADFQPPFFYFLTNLWQKIGQSSEWFLRLPSVFFGITTIFILYLLLKKTGANTKLSSRGGTPTGSLRRRSNSQFDKVKRRLWNVWAQLRIGGRRDSSMPIIPIIACLLFATAPFHIYFSQEYRMYSFFTFLVTLSWYFLYRGNLAKYGLVTLLSVFTHYFSVLVIISQALWIIFYRPKNVKSFFAHLALFNSPFLFWLPILREQIETARILISLWPQWSGVAGPSFLKFPPLLLAKFTVGMTSPDPKWLYGATVFIVGSIFIYSLTRLVLSIKYKGLGLISHHTKYIILNTDKKSALFLFWFFIPTGLAWLSSLWITGSSPHRLLFVLPAFYALIGFGLSSEIFAQIQKNVRVAPVGGPQKLPAVLIRAMPFLGETGDRTRAILAIIRKRLSLILFVILLSINSYFSVSYLLENKWHREDWRSAISYTDKIMGRQSPEHVEGRLVLTEQASPWAPMDWYSQRPKQYIGASTNIQITDDSIAGQLNKLIASDQLPITKVILYTYLFELSDPNRLVEGYLVKNGYTISEEKDFRGVGIVKVFDKTK